MEYGFYHPDRGYWQAVGGDPDELMEGYPEGTEQVPLRPGPDYEWQDGEWVEVPPPPPSPPPSAAEKIDAMLAAFGLTREEFKQEMGALLDIDLGIGL